MWHSSVSIYFNVLGKNYKKNYFDLNLIPQIKNELIEKVIIDKIPEPPIEPDDVDSLIPGIRDKIIKLGVNHTEVKSQNKIRKYPEFNYLIYLLNNIKTLEKYYKGVNQKSIVEEELFNINIPIIFILLVLFKIFKPFL